MKIKKNILHKIVIAGKWIIFYRKIEGKDHPFDIHSNRYSVRKLSPNFIAWLKELLDGRPAKIERDLIYAITKETSTLGVAYCLNEKENS